MLIPIGRRMFIGEVVKLSHSFRPITFGKGQDAKVRQMEVLKMDIRLNNYTYISGSCPAQIAGDVKVGDTIEFQAEVKASRDVPPEYDFDRRHAYFYRPRAGKILARGPEGKKHDLSVEEKDIAFKERELEKIYGENYDSF